MFSVQSRVVELSLAFLRAQTSVDAAADGFVCKQVFHGGPLRGVDAEHGRQQLAHGRGVLARQRGHAAEAHDALVEVVQVGRLDGHVQRAHLEEQHSQRPDVDFARVGAALEDLGGDVVGRPDLSLGLGDGVVEHAGDSEVSEAEGAVGHEEDVLGFDVAVDDFPVVNVF
jgi:hypothetical protein